MKIIGLQPEHWPLVDQIYYQGIQSRNATFETDTPSWEAWDNNHLKTGRYVALIENDVAGWAALLPVSDREVYKGVAEVSIYVGKNFHGLGVGKALLKHLIGKSEEAGFWLLQAILFPENTASCNLHIGEGFREVGYREKIGKHFGEWRNTVLLERRSSKIY